MGLEELEILSRRHGIAELRSTLGSDMSVRKRAVRKAVATSKLRTSAQASESGLSAAHRRLVRDLLTEDPA